MKVNVYSNKEREEKVLLGTFEDFEKAEQFLLDYAKNQNLNINTIKKDEIAETHKKYYFDGSDKVFTLIKHIEVVAAIIINNGKVFSSQRGYGEFKDGWEFPGGKIQKGESQEEALIREIKEELNADINVVDYLTTVSYEYPKFNLIMHTYICSLVNDPKFVYHNEKEFEHENMVWLEPGDLDSLDWLPADIGVIDRYRVLRRVRWI